MSLALYRKYRPGSFADVLGQEHVTVPLQQALRNGRIHHAYLFSGPRGCGKTSSARILARSLNCEQGPTPDPCGVCDSCVALAPNGPGSLDVVEIDAASHGGVDDARDLRERAFYAPVSSRYKIYIIDEAHMVSREGFNALLKLVEEPPEFLRFVFATTEPEKVLATIRSRTHHYPFRLMPRRDLTDLLAGIIAQEGIPVDPTVLPLVVRAAAGSARDGLSILDQVLASAGAEGVTRESAASLLGVTPDTLLDDILNAFAGRDGAAVFAAVDRVMENGHDPRRFAADVLERLRDLIVLDAIPEAGEKGLLDCPPEQLITMAQQVATLGTAGLSRAADLFHAGLTEMRGTTSPRLLLELVCARVLLPSAATGDGALMARLERLERRLDIAGPAGPAGPPGPIPVAAYIPPAAVPAVGYVPPAPAPAAVPATAYVPPAAAPAVGYVPPAPAPAAVPATAYVPPAPAPVAAYVPPAAAPAADYVPPAPAPAADYVPPAAAPVIPALWGADPTAQPEPAPAPAAQPTARSPWPTAAVPGGGQQTSPQPSAQPTGPSAQPSAQPAGPSPQPSPQPSAHAPVEPAHQPAAALGGLDTAALRSSWAAVLDAANENKRATKALLLNAHVVDLSGRTLTLAFTTAALARQFQSSTNIEVFKEALNAVLGLSVDLTLTVAGAAPVSSGQPVASAPSAPTYDGFAPGDEAEPEDPDAPQPERSVGGEDAALKLVAEQLGGTVVGTLEP